MTVVPILLYFNEKGFAKLTIGLAKGKKKQEIFRQERREYLASEAKKYEHL